MRQSLVALCLLALCASASLGSARASQLELQHQSDAESRADSAGDLELEAGLDASTEQDIPPLPNEVMGEKSTFPGPCSVAVDGRADCGPASLAHRSVTRLTPS